jgi:ubiquinone/menaquinone biosynthesis C-methylase UbiE
MTEDGMERTLGEQMLYYEARAGEYDEWWFRTGRYDHGKQENDLWFDEQAHARADLIAAIPHGEVADLACGTGIWTEVLAAHADHVTAVDGSVAMLAKAEERLDHTGLADKATFLQADLFFWRPEPRFDAVFLGFFLSHVPDDLLDQVLSTVAASLKPGGRFLFIDSRRIPESSSPDQPLPDEDESIMVRKLNDGRTFRIIKLFRTQGAMADALARNGLDTDVRETANYFQYGIGTKRIQ